MAEETPDTAPSSSGGADWRTDLGWPQALRILSDEGPTEARRFVTRHLLILQACCFERLLDVLDDPTRPNASWARPIMKFDIHIPFEWDVTIPLRDIDQSTPGRNLYVALSILTAYTATPANQDGSFNLVIPGPVQDRLLRFPPKEAETCFQSWAAFKPAFVSYGFELSADLDNWIIYGRGRTDGAFRASLIFDISPRIIDYGRMRSRFTVVAALPWEQTDSFPPPEMWSNGDKTALRRTISTFLHSLRAIIDQRRDAPRQIRVDVPRGRGGSGVAFFAASTINGAGAQYLERVSPKPIEQSVWRRFPSYIRGVGPTLDITDGRGGLRPLAEATVMALMLHPDNEQMRHEFLAKWHTRILAKVGSSLEQRGYSAEEIDREWPTILSRGADRHGILPRSLVQALDTAPSREALEARIRDSTARGVVIGEMLLTIITCARHHPAHVSVRKAIYLIRRALKDGRIKPGAVPGTSDAFLLREWKRLNPVAHLWAAAINVSEGPDLEDCSTLTVDREFLARAEALRLLGEQCFGRGQRRKHGPVLDPSKTWRMPRDLELPRVRLKTQPLPERALAWLAEYHARQA